MNSRNHSTSLKRVSTPSCGSCQDEVPELALCKAPFEASYTDVLVGAQAHCPTFTRTCFTSHDPSFQLFGLLKLADRFVEHVCATRMVPCIYVGCPRCAWIWKSACGGTASLGTSRGCLTLLGPRGKSWILWRLVGLQSRSVHEL